jgi:hypothetical protein
VIPTDDVERAIEGAQQLQREDGASARIASERSGRRRESGSGAATTTGRKMR